MRYYDRVLHRGGFAGHPMIPPDDKYLGVTVLGPRVTVTKERIFFSPLS